MNRTLRRRGRIAAVALGLLLAGPAILAAQTSQNFEGGGTLYTGSQSGTSTGPASVLGGPTTGTQCLLLLGAGGGTGTNAVAFNRTNSGGFTEITVDFHFRIVGPGEGMGFVLLNTATYGKFGAVPAAGAEEPNFTGSLGIGFDLIDDGMGSATDRVSLHFNGVTITEVPAGVALTGTWIQAHLVVRPGGGNSDVSLTLTHVIGGASASPFTNTVVPGLQPYESRAYFAARNSASQTSDTEIDNVQIVYTADAAVLGKWGGVLTLDIVPIHSTLLPNGKILCWDRIDSMQTERIPRLIDTVTLDKPAGTVDVTLAADPNLQLFCSSHVLLGNGKLFVAGGHNTTDTDGLDTAFTYDPTTDVWTPLLAMGTGGRWYPTVTLLASGDPIVFSGSALGGVINQKVQIWQSGPGTWKTVGPDKLLNYFPYMHLAHNGKIFHSGPEVNTEVLDTTTEIWSPVGPRVVNLVRDYGASVLYGNGKILVLGGGDPPLSSAEVINLDVNVPPDPPPSWRTVASMAYARRQVSTLLLPDGTILVTGGSSASGFNNHAGAVHAAELWDPATETFRTLAGMLRDRLYHSETVLLPDGRVLSLGGGHPPAEPMKNYNDCEVFSPPYLCKGELGPALTSAPARVIYGQVFSVDSVDAATVTAVTLLASTSVTHTNNFTQRILRPSFTIGAGSVSITAPNDPNLCPPAPYLLFLLNANGVPSTAKMILVNYNQPPVAVSADATGEAVDATGGTVQFNGSSSTDPDNNITTYEWFEGMNLLATGASPTVTLTMGVHTITLKVTDGGSLTSTTSFQATIQDTTPPVIQSLGVAPQLLRSLTNQFATVTLNAVVTDTVDPTPTAQVLSVASTESASGLFPGDLTPDWPTPIPPGMMTVDLRSERFAILRRYSVTVQGRDSKGNTSTKSVDVKVRGKWFP